jgi:large subunit ribosomal protein L35
LKMGKVCHMQFGLREERKLTSFPGDMSKPIYRYLADKKWREMRRKILMQRVTQMGVIPDVLPHIDPVARVELKFGRKVVQPGDFVPSVRSEMPPTLDIQVYDKGERLVTIVAVDSDVPNTEKDGFDYRCHGIWANVAIDPTKPVVSLENIAQESIMFPWIPPYAQKGSPYHRISFFVLQQIPLGEASLALNVESLAQEFERDGFVLRSFIARCEIDQRIKLKPVGINMFRTEWDEGTEALMRRHGIPGWDVEYKRQRIQKLPYFRKDGERYR